MLENTVRIRNRCNGITHTHTTVPILYPIHLNILCGSILMHSILVDVYVCAREEFVVTLKVPSQKWIVYFSCYDVNGTNSLDYVHLEIEEKKCIHNQFRLIFRLMNEFHIQN